MRVNLLDTKTAQGEAGFADCSKCPWIVAYLKGDGGVISSGAVILEEADFNLNSAAPVTWSAITGGTFTASDATLGAQKAFHFPEGAYSKVRARITTAIGGGGAITVTLSGNESQ